MTLKEAEEIIKGNLEDYLQRQGINTRDYFRCLNPDHPDKHPSMRYDRERNKAHCFGCKEDYSTLDLIGIDYGLTEYADMVKKGAELYHLQIDETPRRSDAEKRKAASLLPTEPPEQPAETEADYTAFYSEAAKNLSKTDYHTQRGISQATAEYFKLGYVEKWRHPKAQTAPESPRLIIPIGKSCYLARDTRSALTEAQSKYAKSKVGSPILFNEQALSTATEPIFITEGELDAMSIYEAGGTAVALGSVSYASKLYAALEKHPTKQPLILTLDNDRAGERASKEIFTHLKAQGFNICELNVQKPYKDANEALVKNRAKLTEKIAQAKEIAETSTDLAQRLQYEYETQASSHIEEMRRSIEKAGELPEISTGFKNIDSIINGGLYPGLYFIGAISSLGKTTLALQIADNVAKQGRDVLIFSLEMAKDELMAKSISRETGEYSLQVDGKIKKYGRSTADIMIPKRQTGYYDKSGSWCEYDKKKKQDIEAVTNMAFKRYAEYATHIFICEGIGDITPETIKARVEAHRGIYGQAPVVVVDYLQIMASESDRLSDKQRVDKGVVELKRISRDYGTPVIAVSSVNRANYDEPIKMDSFKESGGIEFSSDILIGLQYKGMDYQKKENGKFESDKERIARVAKLKKEMKDAGANGEPQTIQVKILKNRNGNTGTAELNFYPKFNYFKENAALEELAEKIRIRG